MLLNRRAAVAALLLAGLGGIFWWRRQKPARVPNEAVSEMLKALEPPEGPLSVYHLGHSLVGRDMPAMLAQLAGHRHASQLGWGSSLRDHWEPDVPVNGFEAENSHSHFRPAKEAVSSGEFDTLVLTEMVEIRDAIQYHNSAEYLALWANLAHQSRADTRIYLYETWHHSDDTRGWLDRIDGDLKTFWQEQIANPAMQSTGTPVYLIPGGQVMAAVVRELSPQQNPDMLLARTADGTVDTIHFNDLGAYVLALVHYAVLYHQSPVGLPHALDRADGTPAEAIDPAMATRIQEIVWDVVIRHPETGVSA